MKTIEQLEGEIREAQSKLKKLKREKNKEIQQELRKKYAGRAFRKSDTGSLYLVVDGPRFESRLASVEFNKYILPAIRIPTDIEAPPDCTSSVNTNWFECIMEEIPYVAFREALHKRIDDLLQINCDIDPDKVSYCIGDKVYFEDYEKF